MSGATAWEYWCACQGAGACQVQVVSNYVQCFSQSCTKCELKSRRVRSLAALEVPGTSCNPTTIDEQAIAERLDQIATWTSDYPAPIFADDGSTAHALEGCGLAAGLRGQGRQADADQDVRRHSGRCVTASMLLPSGSITNAPQYPG
ncbi:hypothetical protein ACNOYE_11790 [Nannocystaceae bacterium ST9]